MGSHHLVTVCMFCLLCATHSTCSAHTQVSQEGLLKVQGLRHERFKTLDGAPLNRHHARTLARIKKSAEVPIVENVVESKRLVPEENWHRVSADAAPCYTTNCNSKLSGNEDSAYNRLHGQDQNHDGSKPVKNLLKFRERRRKRSVHMPSIETEIPSPDLAPSDDVFYKPLLKNIDVDFYIKKLFTQYGDRETMTMNLAGFEKMLSKLGLERMILEERGLVQPDFVQTPSIESIANGVRGNSTNVTCVNSVDLVVSLNEQQKSIYHTSEQSANNQTNQPSIANMSLSMFKLNTVLSPRLLTKVCPILLYQKVAQTQYENQGCVVEREFPKITGAEQYAGSEHHSHNHEEHDEEDDELNSYDNNRTAVWIYSSLCILAISACGLLGVAVIPIMDHIYYQQILQFFVALAIGTLSGDAMLHLLPHALSPDEHGHVRKHSHAHSANKPHSHDSMWKGLVAVLGVVFFYFTEKGLTLVAEWRKRRMRLNKENKLPSRVRVMRNDSLGCLKGSGSCSSRTNGSGFLRFSTGFSFFKPNSANIEHKYEAGELKLNSGKICKHKYSEYPYCYDEIATDTHDDHHVRDGHLHSANKSIKNNLGLKNNLAKPEDTDDNHLSVVSLYNVKENNVHLNNHEPTVKDSLIVHNYDDSIVETNVHNQANNKIPDGTNVQSVDADDAKNPDLPSKTVNNAKNATGKIELDEIEKVNTNDRESYTVILREHSQTHHGHSHSHGHVHSPPSSLSSVVWMVIMGDGIHNFTDGMAIGAAFSSNIAGGFSTAIAVLCHELPHEIGDFAVLLKAGMSAKRAIFYNLISSILCLFGMILGVIVGHAPEATAWVFAAAAGMFMYIALVDMIPELTSSHSNEGSFCQCILQFFGLASGIGIMLLIAMYEHELKKLFG